MISSFRRLSKSKVGTLIAVLFLLLIAASFALADVSGVMSGGLGQSSGELAEVGGTSITNQDIDAAMQRRLAEVRRTNPEATYADIAGDFEAVLAALINDRAIKAYADKHGFNLSKRLIDAEIATIPAARGLTGQFSEDAYLRFLQQQRMTDEDVRGLIHGGLLQQLLVAPVATNARAPVGMARPYAAMLLERREGDVAFIPVDAFRSGLDPTPAQVQQFYQANQRRYTVPQQRSLRIARIGPEQVANVQPTDQEIAAYYRQNQAQYAASESRTISQAIVQDQATAQALAERARGGQALAAAGGNAAVSTLEGQTRQQYAGVAGEQAAAAVFSAAEGSVVGPVQSTFGWVVAKVDSVERKAGRPLDQVRDEIATTLAAAKREEALVDLITGIEDKLADGASFAEAVAGTELEIVETPLVTASGVSLAQPGYTLPEDLAPALRSGFEMAENDEPVVETLPNDAGYLLVAPARIVPAAPAPLAEIRDRVAADWVTEQASARARAAAQAIEKRAAGGPLQQAAQDAPAGVQVEPVNARRIDLTRFQGRVPPALALLFSMGEGKARMVAGDRGEGFYVVKVNAIHPGNAQTRPALISQMQQQLQQGLAQEYARQFVAAIREAVGVSRNETAIAEAKRRIASGN